MKDNIKSAIKELVIDLKGDDVTEKIIEKWFERNFNDEKRKDRKSNI